MKNEKYGRKQRDLSAQFDSMNLIPLFRQMKIRTLDSEMGIPLTTLFDAMKRDPLQTCQRKTSSVKPYLSDSNKAARIRYAQIKLAPQPALGCPWLFCKMMEGVYIDEKWVYLSCKKTKYYLFPEEDPPQRTC